MNEYEFERLPELPLELFETAGKLGHSGDAPFLTIIPDELEPPQPPVTPTAIPLGESYTRKYLSQVLYPRVVCYPSGDLIDRVAFKTSDIGKNERDVEAIAKHTTYFKLTSLHGERLKFGYFCTVHYGPWSAVVLEEGPCIDGLPPLWRMFVASIPDLDLSWYGTWDDIPSYPNLSVIKGDLFLVGEETFCCPGFRWCKVTNSCISESLNVDCDNISPV